MAGSAKTEFQTGIYPERGTKEVRTSRRSVIAPGIDQFLELFYRYGLHMAFLALLAFSCWTYYAG